LPGWLELVLLFANEAADAPDVDGELAIADALPLLPTADAVTVQLV
jgi:hypothetical protein